MSLLSKTGGKRATHPEAAETLAPPLVSIVLASFNCRKVIENALRSVFEQSFGHKEIIVIDGGSTDGTVNVLEKHDHLIDYWISENDEGIYHALNKGVSLARGEWLYFLGADDYLNDPGVLERIFKRQLNAKLVYGDVILSGNGPVGRDGIVYDGAFSKLKLCYQNICQQAILYHKSLFEELGGFNLNYPILADREFNIKVFANYGENTQYIDEIFAVYNTEGISSIDNGDNLESELPQIVLRELGFRYYAHLKLRRAYFYINGKFQFHIVKRFKSMFKL